MEDGDGSRSRERTIESAVAVLMVILLFLIPLGMVLGFALRAFLWAAGLGG